MSVYDKASLVLIPSGTKTSKVYSQVPVNGDGDFTFSRSTAATRVNADGNIEKETQNLLTQSNTFTSWSNIGGTMVGGQSGYDGSSDAYLFTMSAGANICSQSISKSGVQTLSLYAKGSVSNGLRLYAFGSKNVFTYFDLNIGAVETTNQTIDANIEDIGNDWYRCSMTFDQSTTSVYFYLTNNNNSNASSGSITIQDAQLEQGLVARDYIETTTAAVEGGITDNVPRLDYTDSSCPALLLEPQRTNLINFSEYFEGSYWNTNSNALRSLSSNLSPEGTANAYRVEAVSGTQVGYVGVTTIGTTITHSVYVRRISGSTTFNMVDVNNVATQVDITNDWKRFSVTASATSTNLRSYLRLKEIGDVVEIFGFQAEAGSYATSYIPTYGTAVSRGYEILSTPDLDAAGITTNPTAWTLVIKADYNGNGAILGNNHTISRNEGGVMYRYSSSLGFTSATKGYWTEYNPSTPTAYIWDGTQLRVRRGGSDIRTISAANIGWNSGGINNWTLNSVDIRRISMDVEQILIFNSVLTDTEIDTLTA